MHSDVLHQSQPATMDWKKVVQRFLIPQLFISLYYMVRYRCLISPKAEVEFSPNVKMARKVTISSFTKIKATDGPLVIGKETGFSISCFVSASYGGIIIGDHCMFGPNVNIMSSNYVTESDAVPFSKQGAISRGVKIGNNVWVGAGTTILDGTVLGDNTIVAANSLVNRRFPANVVLQGNPAKVILNRNSRG